MGEIRRGRTLQRVAVSLIKPESIKSAVQRLRGVVRVGNYSFSPQPLRLGDLSGNRFELAIKDVAASLTEDELNATMAHFSTHGFINYFGMQRFGTSEVATHKIGLAVLQRDFQGVIDLILAPRPHQFCELRQALEEYTKSKNAATVLSTLSYKLRNSIEARLLKGLSMSHENDKVTQD